MSPQPARTLARGAVQFSALRVSALAASLLVSIVVARLLGPAGSGEFALALALFVVLGQLSLLGINLGVVWQVGGGRWVPGSAFVTTQVAAAALGAAGAAIGLAAYLLARDQAFGGLDLAVVAPVLAALPFYLAWTFAVGVALALERYEAAAGISAAQAVAFVLFVAVLTTSLGLEGATLGMLASQIVAAAIAAGWGRGALGGRRLRRGMLQLRQLGEAIRFGLKPYLANLLSALKYRVDFFVLGAYATQSDVGYYAVAVAPVSLLGVLPGALATVLFPRLTAFTALGELGAGAREQVETRALRHTVLLTLSGSVVMVAAVLLLLEPIYGAEFAAAVEPALLLCPGGAALGLASVVYAALAGRGHPGYALRAGLITTPPTIALYFAVIPALGASGAAIASSSGYAASAALSVFFLGRASGLPVLARLVPGGAELADYRALAARIRRRG